MRDQEIPSGRWVGFYVYSCDRERHRMDLRLEITPPRIAGDGIDPVGRFVISGRVHEDGRVNWVKTYLGRHDVLYEGFADANGIWGTWTIPPYSSGGFRIWPEAWGEVGSSAVQERRGSEVGTSAPQHVSIEEVESEDAVPVAR